MKICITGINGFVGKNLRKTLEDSGHDVFGIDIASEDVKVRKADITDLKAVKETIADIAPDFIFHLAAISMPDFSNPDVIYAVNVAGSYNVLSAAISLDNIPRIIFASSAQVYGNVEPEKMPISEDCPVDPVNHYGASKAAVEDILRAFNREHGLQFVIVRPFNHIGLGQNPHFVVPKLISAFREKREFIELGNTETVRDFLDVRDAVRVYAALLETFPAREVFNVSTNRGVKISEIISILEDMCGYRIELRKSRDLYRRNEIGVIIGDNGKLKGHLNWEPEYSLRDTLAWVLRENE